MMNKTEMESRINELERRRFYLSMKDRWNSEDYTNDRKMWMEILDLKKKIEAM